MTKQEMLDVINSMIDDIFFDDTVDVAAINDLSHAYDLIREAMDDEKV